MKELLTMLVLISFTFAVKAQSRAITGNVKNRDGQVLSHTRVMLVNKWGVAPRMETTTDDNGNFSIISLPNGQYNVMCIHDGYLNKIQQDVAVNSNGDTHLDIVLERYIRM